MNTSPPIQPATADHPKNPSPPDEEACTCALIINRESGVVTDRWDDQLERDILDRLRDNGWNPRLYKVEGEEIESTVQRALDRKVGAIIAGGGDGTTISIAAQLRNTDMPLGILPFGTLNLAARNLGMPLDPREAVASLRPANTRKVDTLLINERPCLCMAVLGFYPWVLEETEEFHGTHWWMKFWHTGRKALQSFTRTPLLTLRLTCAEGHERELKTRFAVVIPGGMDESFGLIPQREELRHGNCSIYTSKHTSRWSMALAALRYFIGRSASDPQLDIVSSRSIRIEIKGKSSTLATIDGENVRLDTPIQLELKPASLRVLTPQSAS